MAELKNRLNQNIDRAVRHLLPAGKRDGHEWCVGSIGGEKGQSLKVHLHGAKTGVWSDFATGDGGDVIDLWKAVRGLSMAETHRDINDFLGFRKPEFHGHREKSYRRPANPVCAVPQAAVLDYLREDRNLSAEAIAAYRIGEQDRRIIFRSFVDDELVFAKYLAIDRGPDGKKDTRPLDSDLEPVLFGWQAIPPDARAVTITEGEIDAPSLWDYGYPALSVPFGGGGGDKQQWIEREYERLSRFDVINLCLDNDASGQQALDAIIPRLGRHRCRVVRLPRKDANQCLVDGVAKAEIDRCFAEAKTEDPEELRPATAFRDDVINLFFPPDGEEKGYHLPWEMARGKVFFRPSEVTVWQGATGDGKTEILGHTSVGFMDQGARVCIASLEWPPADTVQKIVKQITGTGRPTQKFINSAFDWLDGKCWVFNVIGWSKVERVLTVFEYAHRRYGVDVLVLDSFMRLGVAPGDYDRQKEVILAITEMAIKFPVQIHVVAHSRKRDGKGGSKLPETDDVKGTSEITENPSNVLGVWRNRPRERKVAELQLAVDQGDSAAEVALKEEQAKPATILNVTKQRRNGWEGTVGLDFNTENLQFRSSRDPQMGWQYVSKDNAPLSEEAVEF